MSKWFKLSYAVLISSLSLLMSSGCERVMNEPKSMVIIDLPSLSTKSSFYAQNASVPDDVFITLSNPDKSAPRHMRLDGEKPLEIEVPRGATRVLQILAIYPGLFDTAEVFHGFSSFTADQDFIVVKISLSSLGEVSPGEIGGRIVPSAGLSLTGGLVARLHLNTNLAPMEIHHSNIINGWFHSFIIAGDESKFLGLTYDLVTPLGLTPLLGPPKHALDFTPGISVSHVFIPRHQKEEQSDGISEWRPQEPRLHILGFWNLHAQTLAGPYRVYDETSAGSASFSELKPLNCNLISKTCTNSSSFSVSASPHGTSTALNAALLSYTEESNTVTGPLSILRNGGSETVCNANDMWSTCLPILINTLENGHDHSLLGDFTGAFRFKRATGTGPCGASPGPCQGFVLPGEDTLTILPGVIADAVKVYYLPMSPTNDSNHKDSQVPCLREQLLNTGFRDLNGVSINATRTEITLPKTQLDLDAKEIAICGSFNGRSLPHAIILKREHLGLPSQNNNGAVIQINSVKVTSPQQWYKSGDTLSIEVQFSSAVTVVGSYPLVPLSNGMSVPLSSGSGTSTLTGSATISSSPDIYPLIYPVSSGLNFTAPATDAVTGVNAENVDVMFPTLSASGILNLSSQSVGIDVTPPGMPGSITLGEISTSSISDINFSPASESGSGIQRYEVAIYDEATEKLGWTPIMSSNSLSGLALTAGPYTLKIRAIDHAGNMGPEAVHAFTVP